MKELTGSRTVNNIIKAASMLTVCVAAIIGVVSFRADITVVSVFIAFLLFYVMLPGLLVMDNLGVRSDHLSTHLARSFFMGFALNIILYYLNVLTGADILLLITGPVLSVLYIVQRIRGKSRRPAASPASVFENTPASFFVFAALVFLYSILTTQYTYIGPDSSAFSYIKIDFAYHAGIVNALTDHYPPLDPWVDGLSINYHFFTEMLMSIPAKLFGLAPEKIILSGTPYLIAPVLSVSLYSFFREFAGRKDRAGLYCLAMHFANMFMLKEFPRSWFLYHVYSNYDNAGLGISCLLTVLPLLRSWDRTDSPDGAGQLRSRELFLLAVYTMLMTGIKGPVAIVLIGGIIGTLILGLIMRKVDLKTAGMAVLSVISFVLIYMYVLGSQHSNTSGGSVLNIGEVTDIFFLKEEIMDAFGGSHIVAWGILFGALCVIFFMAFLLPFIVGYVRELALVLTGRKDFIFSRVVIYAICMVGFLGMILLDFSGHSQVYFGFTCAMLVPMVAFWYFEDLEGSKAAGVRFVRTVFAVCLCISACTMIMCNAEQIGKAVKYSADPDKERSKYKNVSAAEYEGLIWLRDNTDEESLIASDRYYSVNPAEYAGDKRSNNEHFAYAVYSQRRQYIEGSGFSFDIDDVELRMEMIRTNKQLYDAANEDRGDLARSLGVDYVVVSKRFDDAGDLDNEDYDLCFSNEGMDIYEIKEAS